MATQQKIAVVIPSFKVKNQILGVISNIGPEVDRIYVADDCCPQNSGIYVQENCNDSRVTVIFNSINLGVGGTVMNGYSAAIQDNMSIIVKVDGDGQMDPDLNGTYLTCLACPFFLTSALADRRDWVSKG